MRTIYWCCQLTVKALGTKKRVDVINYLRNKNPHILCLQETHWINDDEKFIKNVWDGECFINGNRTNARGVAILLNKNFEYSIKRIDKDTDNNLLMIDIYINNSTFRIFNIYVPNLDSPEFFRKISALIQEGGQDYTVICGDLNLTLEPEMDSYNYKRINNPLSRGVLLDTMSILNLQDVFRTMHPTSKRYTWFKRNPIKQARLDYFICSNTMIYLVTDCNIKPGYRSDHSAIELKIKLNNFTRGKGVWKFNCSLLKDPDYLALINKTIDQEKINYAAKVYNINKIPELSNENIHLTISDCLFLENILVQLRGETIKYASYKKKNDKNAEKNLVRELEKLELENSVANINKISDMKDKLESLRNSQLQGIMTRARVDWLNQGEKPSKYLCSLERINYVEKTIKQVKTDAGMTLSDQKLILLEVESFYQKLFKARGVDLTHSIDSLINVKSVTKLTKNQSAELEGKLTIEELSLALKTMKNNKTPGIDGFPAEFYKVFWSKLKFVILRALNSGYDNGEMSYSLKQCIISCIPKGNKPRNLLKNWRPISLLSVIYKMNSLAIANRLKRVLKIIISKMQTGFLSGRFIGENARLIYDILHITEEKQIPGLLMLIDFEKAFDSVSWDFLYAVLKFFNFGDGFISKHM